MPFPERGSSSFPARTISSCRNYGTPVVDEVEQFVTGHRTPFADRMRTTILFTDIVDSTPLAASLGDVRWSALIDDHNDRVHRNVVAHGGHEVKSTGDGFLVAFDEPELAIRCARASMDAVRDLELLLRAGIHVGEVTRMGKNDLSGLAVHFAQRLCGRAQGGQVLVSAAVREGCTGLSVTIRGAGLRRSSRGSLASGRSSRPSLMGAADPLTCD